MDGPQRPPSRMPRREAAFWRSSLTAPALLRTKQAFEVCAVPISKAPQVTYTTKWFQRTPEDASPEPLLTGTTTTLSLTTCSTMPERCLLRAEDDSIFVTGPEIERLLGKGPTGGWRVRQTVSYVAHRLETKTAKGEEGLLLTLGSLEVGKTALGVLTVLQTDASDVSLAKFLPARLFPETSPVPIFGTDDDNIDSLASMASLISTIVGQ